MRLLHPGLALGLVAACLAAAGPAAADSRTVLVGSTFYDPQTVTIDAGDAVIWTVGQGRHTVSSTLGVFDSGPLAEGQTFSYAFTTPGTFTYRDRLNPGVATGTVIVQAVGNAAPTASLKATPASAPARTAVAFDGSASSDPDGHLVRFQWDFDGDGAFETDTGATAAISHTYSAPGVYSVGLLVTDDRGSSALAPRVPVTITKALRAPDTTAPDLSYLGARPQTICVHEHRSCRTATRVTLDLGEDATVTTRLERLRANRRALVVRRSSRKAKAGRVRLTVPARGLKPGRYRFDVSATDAAGNRSATVQPRLTVRR